MFLFPPFSCTKEKWDNETCDRPLRPESASNSAAFQDGDQQIYQGFNSFRYVDNVSRFDRRLFPYSYFPQVPPVTEICFGRQGIRFQDNAFWPIYSPSSIYQNFTGSGSTFTQPVNFHPFLFERFPVEKYVPISSERSYQFCDRVAPQTGFPNFMEEVGASTQPRLHFSRGTLSDRPGDSFSPEEKIVTLQFLVNKFVQVSSVPARQFLQLIGFLISLMDVIPLGRLQIRSIQWYLREFWHPVTQMWEACIPVLPRLLLPHLQWWLQRSNLLTCVPLDPQNPH